MKDIREPPEGLYAVTQEFKKSLESLWNCGNANTAFLFLKDHSDLYKDEAYKDEAWMLLERDALKILPQKREETEDLSRVHDIVRAMDVLEMCHGRTEEEVRQLLDSITFADSGWQAHMDRAGEIRKRLLDSPDAVTGGAGGGDGGGSAPSPRQVPPPRCRAAP